MREQDKPLSLVFFQRAIAKCRLDIESRGRLIDAGETERLNIFHN
jgi:hypothetical protein